MIQCILVVVILITLSVFNKQIKKQFTVVTSFHLKIGYHIILILLRSGAEFKPRVRVG